MCAYYVSQTYDQCYKMAKMYDLTTNSESIATGIDNACKAAQQLKLPADVSDF